MGAGKFLKHAWRKIKPIVAGVAPLAAGALGGPFGPLAAGLIKSALGDPTLSDQAAIDLIATQDPTVLLKLRQVDADLEIRREELGIRREEIYLADVQSARKRQMETGDREPAHLTYIAMGAVAALVGLIIYVGSDLQPHIAAIIGVVIGEFMAAMQKGFNYFLGSSAGSKAKSEDISQMMANGTGDGT